jgi:hypothetical protein
MTSVDAPGRPPWRVVVAITVMVALAVGVVLVSLRANADEAAPGSEAAAAVAVAVEGETAGALRPETVLSDLDDALAAWGEFAVSGDLTAVDPFFAATGPQRAQLETEAPAIAADPAGPPPYVFDIVEYGGATTDGDVAEVVAGITLSRPGEPESSFRWRIEMRWLPGAARWQLWTVTALD